MSLETLLYIHFVPLYVITGGSHATAFPGPLSPRPGAGWGLEARGLLSTIAFLPAIERQV